MTGTLDRESFETPCPNCGRKITETIGKLKLNPKLTCRACGQSFPVDANQLRAVVQKVEKSLADLQRALGRFGK